VRLGHASIPSVRPAMRAAPHRMRMDAAALAPSLLADDAASARLQAHVALKMRTLHGSS